MNTHCDTCAFLQDNECKLNKLEKFKILDTVHYNDENKPIIVNRVCPYHRPESWLIHHEQNCAEQLKKEAKLNVVAIVEFSTLEKLTKYTSEMSPSKWVVLLKDSVYNDSVVNILKSTNVPFTVRQILSDEPIETHLNSYLSQTTVPLYLWISRNASINTKILISLEHYILEDMNSFIYAGNDESEISLSALHHRWDNNIKQHLLDEGAKDKIMSYEALCNTECSTRAADKVVWPEMLAKIKK